MPSPPLTARSTTATSGRARSTATNPSAADAAVVIGPQPAPPRQVGDRLEQVLVVVDDHHLAPHAGEDRGVWRCTAHHNRGETA